MGAGRSRRRETSSRRRRRGEPPGEQRRAPRVEVRLARELRTSSGSSACAACSSSARRVAAAALGANATSAAQQVHPRALELVERPGLRGGQQPARLLERARLEAGLGGRERAVRPPRRVPGQRDGALQERGGGGEPAARLRPAG